MNKVYVTNDDETNTVMTHRIDGKNVPEFPDQQIKIA